MYYREKASFIYQGELYEFLPVDVKLLKSIS